MGMGVPTGMGFPWEWGLDLSKDGDGMGIGNTTTWEWERLMHACRVSWISQITHYATLCDLCLRITSKMKSP